MDEHKGRPAWIAPTADVIGNVTIGEGSSVWFHATLRSEGTPITIGAETNIQDNCVIHVHEGYPVTIGDRVTIGHGAIVHGCTVGDETLIGMGAIILNGARIGKGCIIGAGSLVTQHTEIPDGMLALGSPARVVRALTREEREANQINAREYVEEAETYRKQAKK